uniref:Uncharacterized protein n=1 Tax=Rangifer tarandus platyrhynchus TaxID=3082113 RepID=A0ACB0DTJ5_RANTA|nr:unnamed protein product [Rangifer tarandus platyrhynchus]
MARTRAEPLPAPPAPRGGAGAPRASSRAGAGRLVCGRGAVRVRGTWLTRGPQCASPARPPPPRERKPRPGSALCVLGALRQRVTVRGAGPRGREGRDGGAALTGRRSDLKRQRDSGGSQSQPGLGSREAGLETSETAVQVGDGGAPGERGGPASFPGQVRPRRPQSGGLSGLGRPCRSSCAVAGGFHDRGRRAAPQELFPEPRVASPNTRPRRPERPDALPGLCPPRRRALPHSRSGAAPA